MALNREKRAFYLSNQSIREFRGFYYQRAFAASGPYFASLDGVTGKARVSVVTTPNQTPVPLCNLGGSKLEGVFPLFHSKTGFMTLEPTRVCSWDLSQLLAETKADDNDSNESVGKIVMGVFPSEEEIPELSTPSAEVLFPPHLSHNSFPPRSTRVTALPNDQFIVANFIPPYSRDAFRGIYDTFDNEYLADVTYIDFKSKQVVRLKLPNKNKISDLAFVEPHFLAAVQTNTMNLYDISRLKNEDGLTKQPDLTYSFSNASKCWVWPDGKIWAVYQKNFISESTLTIGSICTSDFSFTKRMVITDNIDLSSPAIRPRIISNKFVYSTATKNETLLRAINPFSGETATLDKFNRSKDEFIEYEEKFEGTDLATHFRKVNPFNENTATFDESYGTSVHPREESEKSDLITFFEVGGHTCVISAGEEETSYAAYHDPFPSSQNITRLELMREIMSLDHVNFHGAAQLITDYAIGTPDLKRTPHLEVSSTIDALIQRYQILLSNLNSAASNGENKPYYESVINGLNFLKDRLTRNSESWTELVNQAKSTYPGLKSCEDYNPGVIRKYGYGLFGGHFDADRSAIKDLLERLKKFDIEKTVSPKSMKSGPGSRA